MSGIEASCRQEQLEHSGPSYPVVLHPDFSTVWWSQGSILSGRVPVYRTYQAHWPKKVYSQTQSQHRTPYQEAQFTGRHYYKNALREGTPSGPPFILGLGRKETTDGRLEPKGDQQGMALRNQGRGVNSTGKVPCQHLHDLEGSCLTLVPA